jgi:L-iditol 2-dehydrogenase
VLPGADVAVVGCGPIGLLLIQALRVAGAGRVVAVEPLPHRRAAAAAAGATVVMTPEEATATRHAGDPEGPDGVDIGFDVSGTDGAVDVVVRWTRPGGRVVMVGIPPGDSTTLTAATVRRKGLTLAWSRRMGEVYPRAIELATGGGVDLASLVSARYPLTAAAEALRDASKRSGLKVIVAP